MRPVLGRVLKSLRYARSCSSIGGRRRASTSELGGPRLPRLPLHSKLRPTHFVSFASSFTRRGFRRSITQRIPAPRATTPTATATSTTTFSILRRPRAPSMGVVVLRVVHSRGGCREQVRGDPASTPAMSFMKPRLLVGPLQPGLDGPRYMWR